jgi:pyridoxamine 5'-phosphate oxidase
MKSEIASIRQEYLMASLSEHEVDQNPVIQFQQWFQQAVNASIEDVNAMTLSTVNSNHLPKSRIVLLKGVYDQQFIFYTNYQSQKGQQMENNPHVALDFYWKELQRQVRIEGSITKTSEQDSIDYFHTRPTDSQLSAWASQQSELLESREVLEARFSELQQKFGDGVIPKPPHWGGYAVNPTYIEFWQGRANRLHDRICYRKVEGDRWQMFRLNP